MPTLPLKTIKDPRRNRTLKLGGYRIPLHRRPRVKMSRLINPSILPDPPSAGTSYESPADKAIRQMYLNDQLGDCVIAGIMHRMGIWTGNATGTPVIATQAQVIQWYGAIGGYDPKNPDTDQGCDMQTAADYCVTHGYPDGSKDLGVISVDATNPREVAQAMWLFEDLDFGMALPDAWISPFPSGDGFVWDVSGDGDPSNGHCVAGVDLLPGGSKSPGILIDTWAMTGTLTFKAIAQYAAETNGGTVLVHINADQLAQGMAKAPNGFDWGQLIAYFNAIGGNVPVPAPAPSPAPSPAPNPKPTPTPTPSSGVTFAQAQTAIAAGFKSSPTILQRAQAIKIADAALAPLWK
jgi:hypothetical protein